MARPAAEYTLLYHKPHMYCIHRMYRLQPCSFSCITRYLYLAFTTCVAVSLCIHALSYTINS